MKSNIVLIGFMGTGKSSIGRRLAAKLHKTFIDTDREIENVTGLSIDQLFNRFGETRFRSEEELIVKKVSERRDCIIATGGGVVLNPDNVACLRQNGTVICLTASPQVIHQRVGRRNRPLLKKDRSPERIEQMLRERDPFYRCADLTIDTTNFDPDDIIQKIMEFISGGAAVANTES